MDPIAKASTFLLWYKSPTQFFKDIFNKEPYEYQKKILESIQSGNKRIIIQAASSTGKTRLLAGIALWLSIVVAKIEKEPIRVVIISGSKSQAKYLYDYCREAFNNEYIRDEIEGDALQSITKFKTGSEIRALPNSLKAIQGLHSEVVLIDEAVLAGDFLIQDALRITSGMKRDIIILSGTPMDAASLFVNIFQDTTEYPDWKRFSWTAKECPRISVEKLKEAESLPEEVRQVFWEGKPYLLKSERVVEFDALKDCVKDIDQFLPEGNNRIIAGLDWGYCLTGESEVLTPEGWVKLSELKDGQQVLVLKKDKMTSEYEEVFDVSKSWHQGNFIHIKSRNFEIKAKPLHPVPVFDRSGHFELHYFKENLTHHRIIRRATFNGEKPEYFQIGHSKYPIVPFLKLFGWYVTEGSKHSKTAFVISQSPASPYFNEIESLGKELGIHVWADRKKGRNIFYDKNLADYFRKLGHAREKFIPKEIKNLHGQLLEIVVETMLKGDGDKFFPRFNTYSLSLANDFQEIACKTGKYHAYIVNRGQKGYRVNLLQRDTWINKNQVRIVNEKHLVVRFRVPSEIVFIRYNGKVSFQHNEHYTAIVILQKVNDTYRVLYCDQWRREQFEDIHQKILEICRHYNVETVYADAENAGENQRLEAKGIAVEPVPFQYKKTQMQSRMRLLFHQRKIKIPQIYQDLIQELRMYNWNSKSGDDLVDALMLGLYNYEKEHGEIWWKIV